MYIMRFDGLFRALPGNSEPAAKAGFMSFGWLISRNGLIIARGHGVVARGKDATSNVAEYLAMIEGMEALLDLGVENEQVKICGDARCVIDQMRGESAVNSETIKPLFHRAERLARRFVKPIWVWTPRKHNKAADRLTRIAMRQARRDQIAFDAAVRRIKTGDQAWNKKFLSLVDLRVFQPGLAIP